MKPMLAHVYDSTQSVEGWLITEKLDGWRAIWDGTQLVSRLGNRINAPEWFTRQLPAGVVLDGELFMGRGNYWKLTSALKKSTPLDAEWMQIQFCVFDAPSPAPFAQRLAAATAAVEGCAVAQLVQHRLCAGEWDAMNEMARVVALGGEGVVLRNPSAPYAEKRSHDFLKLKPYDSETEKRAA